MSLVEKDADVIAIHGSAVRSRKSIVQLFSLKTQSSKFCFTSRYTDGLRNAHASILLRHDS